LIRLVNPNPRNVVETALNIDEIGLKKHRRGNALVFLGYTFLLRRQKVKDEMDRAVHLVEAAAEALPGIFLCPRRFELVREKFFLEPFKNAAARRLGLCRFSLVQFQRKTQPCDSYYRITLFLAAARGMQRQSGYFDPRLKRF